MGEGELVTNWYLDMMEGFELEDEVAFQLERQELPSVEIGCVLASWPQGEEMVNA